MLFSHQETKTVLDSGPLLPGSVGVAVPMWDVTVHRVSFHLHSRKGPKREVTVHAEASSQQNRSLHYMYPQPSCCAPHSQKAKGSSPCPGQRSLSWILWKHLVLVLCCLRLGQKRMSHMLQSSWGFCLEMSNVSTPPTEPKMAPP